MKQNFTTPIGRITTAIPQLILFSFLMIFYSSCNKLEEDFNFDKVVKPTWNPEFAVPLVNSTLYLSDFLEDSSNLSIITNPDQSISFIYSDDSIISASAGSFINFPDQDFSFPLEFDLPPLPPGFFDTIDFVETYTFIPDTSTQRIDSIFLRDGQLDLYGRTNLNRDNAELQLTILDIQEKSTGQPLQFKTALNNPDGQNAWIYFDTVYDLNAYKMSLNNISDTLQNTITYLIDIVIEGDDNPDLSPYTFELEGNLKDLEFDEAFGYFARYELNFNDSLDIGIFEDVINGGINIGQGSVNLSFDLRNSFGLPVTFSANDLYAFSDVNPPNRVDIELFGPGIPNEFGIASPDISQMGQSAETNLDFTQANFAAAFNLAPTKLYYNLSGYTNNEEDTTAQNFILNESRVVLDVDLQFDLFGSIADFTIEDTVLLNFDQNPDEIDYILFRVNANNGFPIRANAQIYFANRDYQVIDSLLSDDNKLLSAAPVGGPPDYRVSGTNQEITDILIDNERIENIVAAKYLLFRTTLSTTDQDLIKIYDDYNIVLKLGSIVGLTVDNEN